MMSWDENTTTGDREQIASQPSSARHEWVVIIKINRGVAVYTVGSADPNSACTTAKSLQLTDNKEGIHCWVLANYIYC